MVKLLDPLVPHKEEAANQTPTAADYEIGNLTQFEGSVTAVTITPKTGKSAGTVTIYYKGTDTTTYPQNVSVPQTAGTYAVTFDVAAATGWNAASGLSAGNLTINAVIPENQTPTAADYEIGNLTQFEGSVTSVTITPKTGKSAGIVTIYYNGSTTLPAQAGVYAVTFDVAAATGWYAASGLYAGTLTINAIIPENQTPTAADYEIGNLTQFEGSVTAVTITPKTGKSAGIVTIYYKGTDATTYPQNVSVPQTAGTYAVTFDVAAATGWYAASGLSAGNLTINAVIPENKTPTAADYEIGNLTQFEDSVTSVTITPKTGTSAGTVTIYYNGSTTLPAQAGVYAVTFDVAAATGWYAASGLYAGTLTINAIIPENQTPIAGDYNIGNLNQTAGSVTAVTITPKTGKSAGTVTVYYNGSTTLPAQAGVYAVTFDVAAATGWYAASGLYAGTLTINAIIPENQTPIAGDYNIGNLNQTAGSVTAVTITPKTGKSAGTVTIYYNGLATLPAQAGTYTVTFDVAAAIGWYAASGLYAGTLTIMPTPITGVSISITAPITDAVPATAATVNTGSCTAGTVTWLPADNPFKGGTVYTASVTLTAASGHTFTGLTSAHINGQIADVSNNTGASVRLAYTFPVTDTRTVMGVGIALQPTKLVYNHGDTLDLTGLLIQVYYENGSPENVSYSSFAAKNITANPAHGDTLSAAAHNGKPVTITCGGQTAATFSLTVNRINPAVDDFIVSGNETFTYNGSPKAVTVTAKSGKTTGTVTVKYNGNVTVPVNTGIYAVTFDVAADAIYNAASGFSAGTLTINKANPAITMWPTAAAITYGAALSASTLSGGTSPVAGTFAWTTSTIIPPVGTNNYSITFTPTDTANYNTATGTVSITVNNITYTVTQIGGVSGISTTTGLSFTFNASIDSLGITANDITINGTAAAKGLAAFTGSGASRTLSPITVSNTGDITVSINKTGIEPQSKTVQVFVAGTAGIDITFPQIAEGAPSLNKPVIFRSSANGPTSYTFTLNNPGQYDSITWYVYNITGSGGTFTLDSSNIAYNMIGTHVLTLEVKKGGLLYTAVITFEVKQ